MAQALATLDRPATTSPYGVTQQQFVTMKLGEQWFGISVMNVQDVLRSQVVSPIPRAPNAVAGALNIRGRVVTAIDMRVRLNIAGEMPKNCMYVVVEYQQELFALIVDTVGDVLTLSMHDFEPPPANLDSNWRGVAAGIFKLEKGLMMVMDVIHVIDGIRA